MADNTKTKVFRGPDFDALKAEVCTYCDLNKELGWELSEVRTARDGDDRILTVTMRNEFPGERT